MLYRWVFAVCPYLKNVYIVNSVAADSAHSESDIDLFIITEKKRVFEVRIFLMIILQLLRMRVHRGNSRGRFCLSFIVDIDEASLSNIKDKKDALLASYLSTSVHIYNEKETSLFFKVVKKILRILPLSSIGRYFASREIRRAQKSHFKNPSIIISTSVFKFHETDSRRR